MPHINVVFAHMHTWKWRLPSNVRFAAVTFLMRRFDDCFATIEVWPQLIGRHPRSLLQWRYLYDCHDGKKLQILTQSRALSMAARDPQMLADVGSSTGTTALCLFDAHVAARMHQSMRSYRHSSCAHAVPYVHIFGHWCLNYVIWVESASVS